MSSKDIYRAINKVGGYENIFTELVVFVMEKIGVRIILSFLIKTIII